MKNFKELTAIEREKILSQHISTELLVERNTLGFENIEVELKSIDVNFPFELSPVVVDEKLLGKIMVYSSPDEHGRWIRTMIRTYLEGGSVWYKKVDDNSFIAELKFKGS